MSSERLVLRKHVPIWIDELEPHESFVTEVVEDLASDCREKFAWDFLVEETLAGMKEEVESRFAEHFVV